jgi:hypothetical protein
VRIVARSLPKCVGSPKSGKIRSLSMKNVSLLNLPPVTSWTWSPQGLYPPLPGSGLNWPQACTPLARTGTRTEPRHALGAGSSIHLVMLTLPWIHSSNGGIVWIASACRRFSRAAMSYR